MVKWNFITLNILYELLQIKKDKKAGGVAQVVECLP
jgi:hypothetical protein